MQPNQSKAQIRESEEMLQLKYPVGPPPKIGTLSAPQRLVEIEVITQLPQQLHRAVGGLNTKQLATPYRPGGWTVAQVVHHLADSHANAYVRSRLATSGDWPVINPYPEQIWAEWPDAKSLPVELSLAMLEGMHSRWSVFWQSLKDEDWSRGYVHPENGRQTLDEVLAVYAWHSRHHTAHITRLREREGF